MSTISGFDYHNLLSVMDKAEKGPIVEQKDFDQLFIQKQVYDLVERYEIGWDESTMVPHDTDLADRLLAAGSELALNAGVFCIDTGRWMIWTHEELDHALRTAPQEETLGIGDDEVTIFKRRPGDDVRGDRACWSPWHADRVGRECAQRCRRDGSGTGPKICRSSGGNAARKSILGNLRPGNPHPNHGMGGDLSGCVRKIEENGHGY